MVRTMKAAKLPLTAILMALGVNEGENWLIRASNVLSDDPCLTAENALSKVDDNKFTCKSQNRIRLPGNDAGTAVLILEMRT